jgi:sortase A
MTGWRRVFPLLALLVGLAVLAHGAAIPAKAALAQVLLERAWSRTLAGDPTSKPWPWADAWPVAVVEAPRLGARAGVLSEAGGEAMAFGPMLLSQAATPGAPGVAVMAAHRDTHFAFLKDLAAGDELRVTTRDGDAQLWRVTGGEVVRYDRSGVEPNGGPPRLALVTCWPFEARTRGPLRYVLWAELAEEKA